MTTVTLRPNGAGFETGLSPSPNPPNWACVDEDPPNDATDYVVVTVSPATQRDLYAIPSSGIPDGSTINSVTIYWRARKYQIIPTGVYGKPSLRTNGVSYDETLIDLTTAWTTRSSTWNTNPVTSNPWTLDEINALQIGVSLASDDIDVANGRCTQVYVVVDYTAPAAAAPIMDGLVFVSMLKRRIHPLGRKPLKLGLL